MGKIVTITMKTLAASPEGALEAGRTYRVPDDVARDRALELLDGGYAVQGESEDAPPVSARKGGRTAAQTPPPPPAGGAATEALEKLTVDQLKELADEQDIDLGPATKKAEILEVIGAELARREAEGGS